MMAENHLKIRGLIIPVEWDHDGNVLQTALMCHDEQTYQVENNMMGRELYKYLQKEIIALGTVRRLETGKTMISLIDFCLSNPLTS